VENFLCVRNLHLHLRFVATVLFNGLVGFEIFYLLLHLRGLSHQQVRNLRNEVLLAVVFVVF